MSFGPSGFFHPRLLMTFDKHARVMTWFLFNISIGNVNNIPTEISRNTLSKSYMLSLTEFVWDFRNNSLWKNHSHFLLKAPNWKFSTYACEGPLLLLGKLCWYGFKILREKWGYWWGNLKLPVEDGFELRQHLPAHVYHATVTKNMYNPQVNRIFLFPRRQWLFPGAALK